MDLLHARRTLHCALWFVFASRIISSDLLGQGMQGGGGGGGDPSAGAPAIQDPKFRDRMWEAGGPRLSGVNNGKLVVSMEIVGNQSISQHKVLSHMQTRTDRNFD